MPFSRSYGCCSCPSPCVSREVSGKYATKHTIYKKKREFRGVLAMEWNAFPQSCYLVYSCPRINKNYIS